jgi:hypothetical protein
MPFLRPGILGAVNLLLSISMVYASSRNLIGSDNSLKADTFEFHYVRNTCPMNEVV